MLQLKGVRDSTGARRVERALKRVAGVRDVAVQPGSRAKVMFDSSRLRAIQLVLAVRKAGYDAVLATRPAEPPL